MADSNSGRFIWYERMTTDTESAVDFYADVVGWKTQPWGGGYTMWVGSEGPLGGTFLRDEEATKAGAPPQWIASVGVEDVDATVAAAKRAGGGCRVEPMDLPKVGRYALITDPQGASLAVFKPAEPMTLHDMTASGEFTWNELPTTDYEAAFGFYSGLFGWEKVSDYDMGPLGVYRLYGLPGVPLGGMFTRPKEVPGPPAWLYYVHVSDLDQALARARGKDAIVLNGPMEVPGGGRIVGLRDRQGAAFALHTGPRTP
jgi:uncharacterized protein